MTAGDSRVRAYVTSFSVQKQGNAPEENEDACFPTRDREYDSRTLRVAISDGSTEGALSGQWARLLARSFCKLKTSHITRVLKTAQAEWQGFLTGYLRDRAEHRPLQWYEEPGLEQGAFASLLGLQLSTAEPGRGRKPWQAAAVGDSCVFQVRKEELVAKFPMERSRDFDSSPLLIPSNPAFLDAAVDQGLKLATGYWRRGDSFYLATDALSAWFLSEVERRRKPWRLLRDFDTEDEFKPFQEWVSELKRRGRMKNDDVTLLRVDIY